MTEDLRDGISSGNIDTKTRYHAIHNHELLGFYSLENVVAPISNRSIRAIEVAEALKLRSPERGLLLGSIVRSAHTNKGFGQVLVDNAIANALTDKEARAIFVHPANDRVERMWMEDYSFLPVERPEIPRLLYVPLIVDGAERLN
jgi:hypothetical protein